MSTHRSNDRSSLCSSTFANTRQRPWYRSRPPSEAGSFFAVVVAGLQTRQPDVRERTCVIPKRSEGSAFPPQRRSSDRPRRRAGG
jgi:hypothetical protein